MKKLVSLIAVSFLLGACGSGSSEDKFVVGMECNYAPYNWSTTQESETSISLGGAGYCDGYDVMIAQKIADSLGKELEVKKIEWDGLSSALQGEEIDAIIAGMTATPEKKEGIDFTTPYYDTEMVMIVRKDDPLANAKSIQDFAGKSIVGQQSTNYDTVIDQIENVNHLTPKASYPDMIVALKAKEADGVTAELPVAESMVAANPDLAIVHFDEGKGFDVDNSVSIGMKKGSAGSEEFNAVQSALDSISQEERVEMMKKASASAPSNE